MLYPMSYQNDATLRKVTLSVEDNGNIVVEEFTTHGYVVNIKVYAHNEYARARRYFRYVRDKIKS